MLAVLIHRDLTDILAVVTRYFGGTLLGASGLIRAYGQAITEAVDAAGIVERRPIHLVEFDVDYASAGRLENALRATDFHMGEASHGNELTLRVLLNDTQVAPFERWLADASNGRAVARRAGETTMEVPI
jgi:putative IMPACT (imprinted ancient) family translation regulator